jgi:hypothetical protein
MESHMMPISSEGCGASGRYTKQSAHRSNCTDLTGSGRNAVRCSCTIVESSKVHQELLGVHHSIVKYYRQGWEPPEPNGGSWKMGARPGRKLHFSDTIIFIGAPLFTA